MKELIILILTFSFTQQLKSQKLSFDLNSSLAMTNGYGDKLAILPDFAYMPKLVGEIGLQLNYNISESNALFTGFSLAKYSYKPLNAPRWPSQHDENGGFVDIGYEQNGIVENVYVSIPLGWESTLHTGKVKGYSQFYLNLNYSLSRSPLLVSSLEADKFFVMVGGAIGIKVFNLRNASIFLSPFAELKPYFRENDYAYSSEKLYKVGLRMKVRLQAVKEKR